ncbi:SET domain-containing protein [Sergentomyia squamirostris]
MEDFDPTYTKKCSTITVFSLDRGFFCEFYESVRESCGVEWINGTFANIEGDRAKLRSLLDEDASSGPILGTLEHVTAIYKQKDFSEALKRRYEGERKLQEGNHLAARILLSQAIIKAPQGSSENEKKFLRECLWKRSEVLIALEESEAALKDIKLATDLGFPVKQSPEYFWRIAKCYMLSKDFRKAKVSLGLAEKLVGSDTRLREKIEKDKEELEILENVKTLQKKDFLDELKALKKDAFTEGPSEKLEINSSSNKGNYFVASRDINPGDDIICEAPIAACLLPENYGSHCLHCQVRLVAPIGCSNCCSVAFCSQECQMTACTTYHRFECQFLDLLIGSGMSILSFVALRVITAAGSYEKAVENTKNLLDGFCRHSGIRSGEDYLQRCLMAIFLMRILQKTGFFGRRTTEGVEPTTKELHICEILLNLMESLQFNAHEIYDTLLGPQHSIVGSKVVYIGVAIYQKASLFNHDCFPAVVRYFSGNKLHLTALRPIRAGDAVTENYGPVFTKQDFLQRQRNLRSRYWFHCECLSCREKWPLLADLSNRCRIRCPSFQCEKLFAHPDLPEKKIKCTQCKSHVSLLENVSQLKRAESLYRKAAEAMDKNDIASAIDLFKEGLQTFFSVAHPPHRDTHVALESMRVCYSLQGNVYRK